MPLTVAELVAALLQMPQNKPVRINLNEGSWYAYGEIREPDSVLQYSEDVVTIDATYIGQGNS